MEGMRRWIALSGLLVGSGLIYCGGEDPEPGVEGSDAAIPSGSATNVPPTEAGADQAAPPMCSSDVLRDPKNCGRCGHDCLGGACAEGSCLPTTIYKTLLRPTIVGHTRTHLIVAESKSQQSPVQRIFAVTKADGTITELPYAADPYNESPLPTVAYTTDKRVVLLPPVKEAVGGVRSIRYVALAEGSVVADAGAFEIVQPDIYKLPAGSEVLRHSTLFSRDDRIFDVRTSGVSAERPSYYGATDITETRVLELFADGGAVDRMPATTVRNQTRFIRCIVGDLMVVGERTCENAFNENCQAPRKWLVDLTGTKAPRAVGAGPTDLYTCDETYAYGIVGAAIVRVPHDAPDAASPEVLVSGQYKPSLLALDRGTAFWVNDASELATIMTCPLSGCADAPRVLAEKQYGTTAVVADETSVWWSNGAGGNIVRIAK